nr:hypothetical protein [Tanacetum cinerariifolium]
SRTSYAIAADLLEMELKKILIENMEGNKFIQRSDKQRNLYKVLVKAKPPSPDRAWNTALPATQGDAQSWITDLAKQADARSSFNELLDTPIDFSNFIMHRLN